MFSLASDFPACSACRCVLLSGCWLPLAGGGLPASMQSTSSNNKRGKRAKRKARKERERLRDPLLAPNPNPPKCRRGRAAGLSASKSLPGCGNFPLGRALRRAVCAFWAGTWKEWKRAREAAGIPPQGGGKWNRTRHSLTHKFCWSRRRRRGGIRSDGVVAGSVQERFSACRVHDARTRRTAALLRSRRCGGAAGRCLVCRPR